MAMKKELNNINSRLEALEDTLGVDFGEVVMLLHEVITRQSDSHDYLSNSLARHIVERMEDKNG